MDQTEANALIEQANQLHDSGDKLGAAPLYMRGAAFEPFASFALVAGDSYAEAGRHAEAVAAYDVCLASVPDHPDALEGRKKSAAALNPKKGFFSRLAGRLFSIV